MCSLSAGGTPGSRVKAQIPTFFFLFFLRTLLSTERPRRGDSLARRLNICVDRDNFSRRLLVLGKKKKKQTAWKMKMRGVYFSSGCEGLDEKTRPLCVCSPQFTATSKLVPLLIFYGTRAVVLSLLCAHTVSHSPIWKRNTQSPLGCGGKRETSGCRPVCLIICAVCFLGPFRTNNGD